MAPSRRTSPSDIFTLPPDAPHHSGSRSGGVLTLGLIDGEAAVELGQAFSALSPWVVYPYSAAALQAYFEGSRPDAPRYCLRSGDTLIGALGLQLNWLRGPYIQFLGVLPAHQAAGTGARVLEWVEAQARERADRNLWVAASDFNARALSFYERHGFQRVSVLDGLVQDGRDEVLLRKRLQVVGPG
ncbi:MAG: GNAT family N-acetyltransferase [Hyphomicrobium sp.]